MAAEQLVNEERKTRGAMADWFFVHVASCGSNRRDKLSLPAIVLFSLLVLPAFRPTTMNWFLGGLVD